MKPFSTWGCSWEQRLGGWISQTWSMTAAFGMVEAALVAVLIVQVYLRQRGFPKKP